MHIVIEISEDDYKEVKDDTYSGTSLENRVFSAIANGTPLPKEHGRLIDADILRSMYSINRANFNTVIGIQRWIDGAHTIIEADKVESEGAE